MTISIVLRQRLPAFENETFNPFVADFDTNLHSMNIDNHEKSMKRDPEAEVDRLKAQLKQANLEKAEITSKYEKLSAICHSQQQDIEKLKHALAAVDSSPPSKDIHRCAAVVRIGFVRSTLISNGSSPNDFTNLQRSL